MKIPSLAYGWRINIITNSSSSLPQNFHVLISNFAGVRWQSEYASSVSIRALWIVTGWTCCCPWPQFPLCEAGVKEKVIIQVREHISAFIPVDVLGILPYYDGLNLQWPTMPACSHCWCIRIVISLMKSCWSVLITKFWGKELDMFVIILNLQSCIKYETDESL